MYRHQLDLTIKDLSQDFRVWCKQRSRKCSELPTKGLEKKGHIFFPEKLSLFDFLWGWSIFFYVKNEFLILWDMEEGWQIFTMIFIFFLFASDIFINLLLS